MVQNLEDKKNELEEGKKAPNLNDKEKKELANKSGIELSELVQKDIIEKIAKLSDRMKKASFLPEKYEPEYQEMYQNLEKQRKEFSTKDKENPNTDAALKLKEFMSKVEGERKKSQEIKTIVDNAFTKISQSVKDIGSEKILIEDTSDDLEAKVSLKFVKDFSDLPLDQKKKLVEAEKNTHDLKTQLDKKNKDWNFLADTKTDMEFKKVDQLNKQLQAEISLYLNNPELKKLSFEGTTKTTNTPKDLAPTEKILSALGDKNPGAYGPEADGAYRITKKVVEEKTSKSGNLSGLVEFIVKKDQVQTIENNRQQGYENYQKANHLLESAQIKALQNNMDEKSKQFYNLQKDLYTDLNLLKRDPKNDGQESFAWRCMKPEQRDEIQNKISNLEKKCQTLVVNVNDVFVPYKKFSDIVRTHEEMRKENPLEIDIKADTFREKCLSKLKDRVAKNPDDPSGWSFDNLFILTTAAKFDEDLSVKVMGMRVKSVEIGTNRDKILSTPEIQTLERFRKLGEEHLSQGDELISENSNVSKITIQEISDKDNGGIYSKLDSYSRSKDHLQSLETYLEDLEKFQNTADTQTGKQLRKCMKPSDQDRFTKEISEVSKAIKKQAEMIKDTQEKAPKKTSEILAKLEKNQPKDLGLREDNEDFAYLQNLDENLLKEIAKDNPQSGAAELADKKYTFVNKIEMNRQIAQNVMAEVDDAEKNIHTAENECLFDLKKKTISTVDEYKGASELGAKLATQMERINQAKDGRDDYLSSEHTKKIKAVLENFQESRKIVEESVIETFEKTRSEFEKARSAVDGIESNTKEIRGLLATDEQNIVSIDTRTNAQLYTDVLKEYKTVDLGADEMGVSNREAQKKNLETQLNTIAEQSFQLNQTDLTQKNKYFEEHMQGLENMKKTDFTKVDTLIHSSRDLKKEYETFLQTPNYPLIQYLFTGDTENLAARAMKVTETTNEKGETEMQKENLLEKTITDNTEQKKTVESKRNDKMKELTNLHKNIQTAQEVYDYSVLGKGKQSKEKTKELLNSPQFQEYTKKLQDQKSLKQGDEKSQAFLNEYTQTIDSINKKFPGVDKTYNDMIHNQNSLATLQPNIQLGENEQKELDKINQQISDMVGQDIILSSDTRKKHEELLNQKGKLLEGVSAESAKQYNTQKEIREQGLEKNKQVFLDYQNAMSGALSQLRSKNPELYDQTLAANEALKNIETFKAELNNPNIDEKSAFARSIPFTVLTSYIRYLTESRVTMTYNELDRTSKGTSSGGGEKMYYVFGKNPRL